MVSTYLAVTENLRHPYMRCNYHCLNVEKSINQLTVCLHTLQTWALGSIVLYPYVFPISSVYYNLNYLLWRKNETEDQDLDRNTYIWIDMVSLESLK